MITPEKAEMDENKNTLNLIKQMKRSVRQMFPEKEKKQKRHLAVHMQEPK